MRNKIAIIGGGTSALMLAAVLDAHKFEVHIYERNDALGRKFLVAGDGGFNLTHSESSDTLSSRYLPSGIFDKTIQEFNNKDLVRYLKEIGIETYTGSSRRVFPVKGIKPIEVLNAFLHVLKKNEVHIHPKHLWTGWKNGMLLFDVEGQQKEIKSDITVFALGGGSWSVTGSDGAWVELFRKKGIQVNDLLASNSAFGVAWDKEFIQKYAGAVLKNCSLQTNDQVMHGELTLTEFGIEGSPVYALSDPIRRSLSEHGEARVLVDLKPVYSSEKIRDILMGRGRKSITQALHSKVGLTDVSVSLLRNILNKDEYSDAGILAEKIKQVPLRITQQAPMDEAISTSGGIAPYEVDEFFMLKKIPGSYVLGEMLDWDAPTGGYLLQACFSMAHRLAIRLNSSEGNDSMPA